jgi:Ca-activated chloride channel family protein
MKQSHWEKVCDKDLIPYVIEQPDTSHHWYKIISTLIAGILLIIALAGPSWKEKQNPALVNQSALVIALDLSQSMLASDVKPSRLQRAKFKIEDILKKRKEGLTALIVYAGRAFTVTPLTGDIKTILAQLPVLVPSIMPEQGNHPEYAIDLAVDLLKQAKQPKGNILLVTDEVNAGADLDATREANNKGYLLSVLGIGTEQGAPIPMNRSFIKNSRGDLVLAKINPAQMATLASAGGGLFYKMQADNSDVNTLSKFFESQVNSIKTAGDDLKVDSRVQEGYWFVLFSLPFLLLLFRKRKLDMKILSLLLIIPLMPQQQAKADEWTDLFLNQDQIAKKQFDKGKHKESAEKFKDPRWKQAADYKSKNYKKALTDSTQLTTSDDWYNKGNILARLGKTDEAIAAYDKAIKLNSKNEDAIYNKKLLEKQKQQNKDNKDKQNKDKQNKQKNNKDDQSKDSKGNKSDQKKEQNKEQNKEQSSDEKQQQKSQENNKKSQQGKSDKENNKNQQDSEQEKKKNEERENKRKELAKKDQEQQNKEQQKKAQQAKANAEKEKAQQKIKQQLQAQAAEKTPDEAEEEKKQWLRRIPDDPSLLWKRKFYYQYKNNANRKPNTAGEKKW